MAKVKTKKKCPNCKHKDCWINAPTCEQCGFDFRLGRKPRRAKVLIEESTEEDVILPQVEEIPSNTPKLCPLCKKTSFWRAPYCTHCENYSFLTNAQIPHKKVAAAVQEEETVIKEERIPIGSIPIWAKYKRAKWMDFNTEPTDANIRQWASEFREQASKLLDGKMVASSAVADWASRAEASPKTKAVLSKLEDWFVPRHGSTIHLYHSTYIELWRGTGEDTEAALRGLEKWGKEKR